jgi:hypothetical protein
MTNSQFSILNCFQELRFPGATSKMTSALPLTFATMPLPKIEHWSLKICHRQSRQETF